MEQQLPVTGFVLAGGASRRMGQDKTKVVLNGETMLTRQLHLLEAVCSSVTVLGPPANFEGLESVLPDEIAGRGPLDGIYTRLKHPRTGRNLSLDTQFPLWEH